MHLAKHTLANEAKNNNANYKLRTNIMFIVVKKENPIKRANCPKVQVLSKDYVFSNLKYGLHVLDRAHYRMIVPISKVWFTCVFMNFQTICS
jgi:hypothetical protein